MIILQMYRCQIGLSIQEKLRLKQMLKMDNMVRMDLILNMDKVVLLFQIPRKDQTLKTQRMDPMDLM